MADLDTKTRFVCRLGHDLVFVRESASESTGAKRRCHFRHKNSSDVKFTGISKWHAEWQAEFECVEVVHTAFPNISVKSRRADILAGNTVVELQHSPISRDEVDARCADYALHGREVAWVVDGSSQVDVVETSSTFIIFSRAGWIYSAFAGRPHVYLHVRDKVYRVCPSAVKGGYCEVTHSQGVSRAALVKAFRDGGHDTIWGADEFPPPPGPPCCSLTLKQRGAGCGKTYESIRLLDDPQFGHKNVFMYFTRVHSAKQVIFDELCSQASSLGVSVSPNAKAHRSADGKAYRVPFERPCGATGVVYIGTIDSFTWTVCGRKPTSSRDMFIDAVRDITNGFIAKGDGGDVSFKGFRVSMRTLVVVDEAQDLRPEYATALGAIVRETAADCVLIGDKLQSIWGDDNVFTFLERHGIEGIRTVRDDGENCVRRFHDPRLVDFVNAVVPFDRFGLPPVTRGCIAAGCSLCAEGGGACPGGPGGLGGRAESRYPVKAVAPGNDVLANIVKEIRALALERGYLPHDFAVISPVVKNDSDLAELEIKINEMWLALGRDPDFVARFVAPHGAWGSSGEDWGDADHCVLHTSEGGRPIDLASSDRSTRIMSIHAAKGTGTRVVFAWKLTEANLKRFVPSALSAGVGSLQYESLLHVAITRQKKLLFLAWPEAPDKSKRNPTIVDDVLQRVRSVVDMADFKCKPLVPRHCYRNLDKRVLGDAFEPAFANISDSMMDSAEVKQIRGDVVDIEHHDMRGASAQFACIAKFVEVSGRKNQALAKLHKFKSISTFRRVKWSRYGETFVNYQKCERDSPEYSKMVFPVLEYSGKTEYARYAAIMEAILIGAQKRVVAWLSGRACWTEGAASLRLCPVERICVMHVLEAECKLEGSRPMVSFRNFRPSTIYRVFRDYLRDGPPCAGDHESCSCASAGLFGGGEVIPERLSETPGKLSRFHEDGARVDHIIGGFQAKYGKISNFLLAKDVWCGIDTHVRIKARLDFSFNYGEEDRFAVCTFVPCLTALNSMQIATDIAVSRAVLASPTRDKWSEKRVAGRRVDHFIVALNLREILLVDSTVAGDEVFGLIRRAVYDHSVAELEAFALQCHEFRNDNKSNPEAVEDWIGDLNAEMSKAAFYGEKFGEVVKLIAKESRRGSSLSASVRAMIRSS